MGELEGCCCSILKFSYYLVTTMNPRVVKTISYMQRGQDNATRTAPNTDLWQCRKPGRRAAAPFICLAANRHNSRRVGLDGMALGSATAPATDNTVVTAQLLHVPRARTGSEWFYYMKDVPEGKSRTNLRFEQLEVSITDLRSSSELPTLSLNGFQLEHLSSPQKIDWQDESQVCTSYVNFCLTRSLYSCVHKCTSRFRATQHALMLSESCDCVRISI